MTEFIMFSLTHNMGCDMKGKYLVQLTGNEDAIKKFKKINKNNDALKFYKEKYTQDEVIALKKFSKTLFEYDGSADNIEFFIFKGKFDVPGENIIYEDKDLEEWWDEYFVDPKWPKWENYIEEIIDLTK